MSEATSPFRLSIFRNHVHLAARPSPFKEAARLADLERAKELCSQGANPQVCDTSVNGNTPLLWACKKGNMSVVRWLTDDMHVYPTAETDCDDFGPVHNDCWNGHLEMVRMLVVE